MVYRLTLFQHSYLVERFYGKTSTRQIALDFRNNFCLPISAPTVLRKTVEMTKTAIEVMSYLIKTDPAFLPRVGDIWEIDETYFNLGKKETTLIVVKDLKTCYFLAANLERASNIETTTKALLYARSLARKCPIELRGDGNSAYAKACRFAFGRKTKLTINKKIGKMGQDQSIEGTFGASIKSWIKSKRSLHSPLISPILVAGYILSYNFARPCEVLGGITPAEAAMAWNPLDGKRGWPGMLQLAKNYGNVRSVSRKQTIGSRRIFGQNTLDEIQLITNNGITKEGSSTSINNKQTCLSSFSN